MNEIGARLRQENGDIRRLPGSELRGLTGSGEPGLYAVLGGTALEEDSSQLTLTGGPGQVSSVSRMAAVHKDVRIAAVAAGVSIPPSGGGGGSSGGGGGTGGKPPQGRPPGQAK